MRTLTRFNRLYKAEYSVALVGKLMSNGNYVIFTRKVLLNSFKLSARFFKFARYFTKFFYKTDMITIYIAGVPYSELSELKKDDLFLILAPDIANYTLNSFEDFSNKPSVIMDIKHFLNVLNLYLQYFLKTPENGNI